MPRQLTLFISYRRDPSKDLARYIYDKLSSWEVNVFLDVETLTPGRFSQIIEEEISNRDYFLVILTPKTLESEWVRREIFTAQKNQKALILLATNDFDFAQHVPEEVEFLKEYNAILYDYRYADMAFSQLRRALGLKQKTNDIAETQSSTFHHSEKKLSIPQKIFVGRVEELSKLSEFAKKSSIVGIYGQPGVGKSALAFQWLASKSQELNRTMLYIVITENLTCEEIVSRLLLDLGESKDFSVMEEKREALLQIVTSSPMLLLLDNCETLNEIEVNKVEQLVADLASAHCVCILTSRKKFISEHIIGFELAPLTTSDAKHMLKTRAADYDVNYLEDQEIDRLCETVENLPLAIELLAPIIPSKPIAVLIQDIARGDITSIKRLKTAFEISYDALSSEETKKFFRCISVVPKDFNVKIATDLGICSPDSVFSILFELTSRCLIKLSPDNRYSMHAMTRTYAFSKNHEERSSVEMRLIQLYIEIGKQADLWNVSQEEENSWQENRQIFLSELSNITILIDILIQRKDKKVVSLLIANVDALTRSAKRGFVKESIEKVLEIFGEDLQLEDLGKLYAYLGSILHRQRDLDNADKQLHKALDCCLHKSVKNFRFAGFVCIWLGWIWIENIKKQADESKRREEAMKWYRKAYDIAINHGDDLIKVYALHHFGHDLHWKAQNASNDKRQQLLQETRDTYEEVIRQAEQLRLSDRLCRAHSALAKLTLNEGDYLNARYHASASEKIARLICDDRSDAIAKAVYASCLLEEAKERRTSGYETEARALADRANETAIEGLYLLQKIGDRGTIWQTFAQIGDIAVFQQKWEDAVWAYSKAVERHVTSSGSSDIVHLRENLTASIDKQNGAFASSYNRTLMEAIKVLNNSEVLLKNHRSMESYEHIGLTLVWGLPVRNDIQKLAANIIDNVKTEYPSKFTPRQISNLHTTIVTMKKVKNSERLTNRDEWPSGMEEAFHDLQAKLESQSPFEVYFKGITISPRGEVLMCGYAHDSGLSSLRGELKRSLFWYPSPWHKGNLHICLGYFHSSLSVSEVDSLYRQLESFKDEEASAKFDRLKLVHFRDRSLSKNKGSIELPIGKVANLAIKQVLEWINL